MPFLRKREAKGEMKNLIYSIIVVCLFTLSGLIGQQFCITQLKLVWLFGLSFGFLFLFAYSLST